MTRHQHRSFVRLFLRGMLLAALAVTAGWAAHAAAQSSGSSTLATVAASAPTVNEGSKVRLFIELSATPTSQTPVLFELGHNSSSADDIAAVRGAEASTTTPNLYLVWIPANASGATVTLEIASDTTVEANEHFTITLQSSATNAFELGTPNKQTITILDVPVPNADGSYTVSSEWTLKPSDLSTGDKFRLIFVTSGIRRGDSDNIADYDEFVQRHARNGHESIRNYALAFRAYGSTAKVDARDHTDMWDSSTEKWKDADASIATFWLGGDNERVAENYHFLAKGEWNTNSAAGGNQVRMESGNRPSAQWSVDNPPIMTGSTTFGTATQNKLVGPLGSRTLYIDAGIAFANSFSTTSTSGAANSNQGANPNVSHHMYGLSVVFVVGD